MNSIPAAIPEIKPVACNNNNNEFFSDDDEEEIVQ